MSTSFAEKSTCQERRPRRRRLHVALSVPDRDASSAPPYPREESCRLGRLLLLVRAAPRLGIGTLTVRVPPGAEAELAALLDRRAAAFRRRAVRVTVLGPREQFAADLRRAVGTVERATSAGRRLHLRLAVGASSRDAIVAAFQGWEDRPPRTRAEVSSLLGADGPSGAPVPDVDVLVCTGGAARHDDFLLWESARAEIRVVAADAEDLRAEDLAAALAPRGDLKRPARRASAAGARP